ncbi:MAG: DUF6282 family protein [Candidatus Woesebacteria bacterium]|jgi:hypothetical protein
MNKNLKQILNQAIDIHVHVGDRSYDDGGLKRQYTVSDLNKATKSFLVAKAHFLPFVKEENKVLGSVTLNFGMKAEQVLEASKHVSHRLTVWMPTLNAKAHQEAVKNDPFWKKLFAGLKLGEPISVLNELRELSQETLKVLETIKKLDAILATGHLSQQEVKILVKEAIQSRISDIVLTHVSSRHNKLSIDQQQKLIALGKKKQTRVWSEHCAITWIDGKEGAYDIKRDFVELIKKIGPKHCIISSDTGRYIGDAKKPSLPNECLELFCQLLLNNGISLEDLSMMLIQNPKTLFKLT